MPDKLSDALAAISTNQAILRNALFEKYFEVESGILLSRLVDRLSFIPMAWEKLKTLCIQNIISFNSFCRLEKAKLLEYNFKTYFILKLRFWKYVIIDVNDMRNVTELEFRALFNEDFFVNNFDEIKEDNDRIFNNLYHIETYDGDIKELLNFYMQNQATFSLEPELYYRLQIGNAWTGIYIDFVNSQIQLSFQTPDQFLYERIFLNYDLTPLILQDAQEKIGIAKMQEMFKRIKEIKIPCERIPPDLYQQIIARGDVESG